MPTETIYKRANGKRQKRCHEMRTVYCLLHERSAHPDNEALPLNDIPLRDVHSIIRLIDGASVMGFINSQVERAEQNLPFDELSDALQKGSVEERKKNIQQRLRHLQTWRDAHRLDGDIPQGGVEEQPVEVEATQGDEDEVIETEWANVSSFGRFYATLVELVMEFWEWI